MNENVDSVDQTVRFVQSDLDLHCPQKIPVSSSVKKALRTPGCAYLGKGILHFVINNIGWIDVRGKNRTIYCLKLQKLFIFYNKVHQCLAVVHAREAKHM